MSTLHSLIVAIATTAGIGQSPEPIGWVVSFRGEWVAGSTGELIRDFTLIYPGSTLLRRSNARASGRDSIVVRLGGSVFRLRCDAGRNPCNKPIPMRAPPSGTIGEFTVFRRLARIVGGEWRKRLAHLGDLSNAPLVDGVYPVDDGLVRLSVDITLGPDIVVVACRATEEIAPCGPEDPQNPRCRIAGSSCSLPGMMEGLYDLFQYQLVGEADGVSRFASLGRRPNLLLVVEKPRYDSVAAMVGELRAELGSWSVPPSGGESASLDRAVLVVIGAALANGN